MAMIIVILIIAKLDQLIYKAKGRCVQTILRFHIFRVLTFDFIKIAATITATSLAGASWFTIFQGVRRKLFPWLVILHLHHVVN